MPIRIFIDQGHNPVGSPNAGALINGLYEGDINYQIGVYLANLLNNDSRFTARLSRPTPGTILGTNNSTSLAERVRLANQWPADYFISIHGNSNPNPAINGTEVYVYQFNTQAHWLAQQVMAGVTDVAGTKNNGIFERPSLYVLRNTSMPAILVETAYLTNPSDASKLRNNQYLFAVGIQQGILRYFGFA